MLINFTKKMFRNFQNIFSRTLKCSHRVDQFRTTFILKRKNQPRLSKIGAEFPKKLKRKNFYYVLEEDTNVRKREEIELILLKNVKSIGNAGDVIKMKPIRAYESFILTGVATYATPENLEKFADIRKADEIPMEIKTLLNNLQMTHVPVFLNETNPWTIEPWHIKLSLRKIGVICNVNNIKLPNKPIQGPNFELEKKDFLIYLTVNGAYTVPMRCKIFHLTFTESNFNIAFNPKFYMDPINAVFPEEQAILEKIPLPQDNKKFTLIIE